MIPDYQTLMRPVLECVASGEARISDVVDRLANQLGLTAEERSVSLPSGKQTRFANRVNWAKSYLKQGGLVEITGRGRFIITDRGRSALADKNLTINNDFLAQFEDFQNFKSKTNDGDIAAGTTDTTATTESTPDEMLRRAHAAITDALAAELLDRVRSAPPAFFERLVVGLFIAMGYGGSSEEAGRAIGQSGDNGVDGVIDQDPLGVDQIYIQAKRYEEGNNVGNGAIRDFFGALNLKKAQKGIFVTTSAFSPGAVQTARDLGGRIVLIGGLELARLMIRYNVGCRDEEVLHIKGIDEDFFETP